MAKKDKPDSEPKAIAVTFKAFPDGSMLEEIKDYGTGKVGLCYLKDKQAYVGYENILVEADGQLYTPIANSLTETDTILFPTQPLDYGTTAELRASVQDFIHRYVDMGVYFEKLASYYVLLTWLYDSFSVCPYLRVIGEPGTGKSRFLKVMAAVCYKSMKSSGAISVASIFRMLEQFAGTLILDEADLSTKSDEYAAAVKILNCGYEKDTPVIRQEKTYHGYESVAYRVYGPKLIGTRKRFADMALESRCITERMGSIQRRSEIPLILPASFDTEALELRNKLLAYRFRNLHKQKPVAILAQEHIEPRLSQITSALAQIMDDPAERNDLRGWAQQYTLEMKLERGQSLDGDVVRGLFTLIEEGDKELSVTEVTTLLNNRFERDQDKISNRYVGGILRKLGCIMKRAPQTRRYTVDTEKSADALKRLRKQYDI